MITPDRFVKFQVNDLLFADSQRHVAQTD